MSLQVTISGRSESIVKSAMEEGQARSPEEVVDRALSAYAGAGSLGASRKSREAAVADILALREEIQLAGIDLKDLAHQGHKY